MKVRELIPSFRWTNTKVRKPYQFFTLPPDSIIVDAFHHTVAIPITKRPLDFTLDTVELSAHLHCCSIVYADLLKVASISSNHPIWWGKVSESNTLIQQVHQHCLGSTQQITNILYPSLFSFQISTIQNLLVKALRRKAVNTFQISSSIFKSSVKQF
jgi:hypothetical protein